MQRNFSPYSTHWGAFEGVMVKVWSTDDQMACCDPFQHLLSNIRLSPCKSKKDKLHFSCLSCDTLCHWIYDLSQEK